MNLLLIDSNIESAKQLSRLLSLYPECQFDLHHLQDLQSLLENGSDLEFEAVVYHAHDITVAVDLVKQLCQAFSEVALVVISDGEDRGSMQLLSEQGADACLLHHELTPALIVSNIEHAIERRKLHSRLEQLSARQEYLATHDILTDLPNRRLLLDRLQQSIAHAQRYGNYIAIGSLDLDGFKAINDTLGHEKGDILLKTVATRLKENVRASDTVARIAGDEFIIVLTQLSSPKRAYEAHSHIMKVMATPFQLQQQELFVNSNLGIAIYPEDGIEAEALLMNADAAVEQAKKLGNAVQFYRSEFNKETSKRLNLMNHLRVALQKGEFLTYYQPQIDIKTNKVCGLEALVRWQHPEMGFLLPPEFVPLAEECGLIVDIDQWILKQACEQLAYWNAQGINDIVLSVNTSAYEFGHPNFLINVPNLVKQSGISPRQLMLEITESLLMKNPDDTIRIMQYLKQSGLQLAIDDFGIGYSSLNYLKNFPVDTIKIDRSFMSDILTTPETQGIVKAIIALANILEITLVVEGVDSIEKEKLLKKMGCHVMQGFFYSEPLPPEECTEFLIARNKPPKPSN